MQQKTIIWVLGGGIALILAIFVSGYFVARTTTINSASVTSTATSQPLTVLPSVDTSASTTSFQKILQPINSSVNKNNQIGNTGIISDWEYYRVDNSVAYFLNGKINGADAPTFRELRDLYAKDINKVYYEGRILADADASTFVMADGYAKDKNHLFYNGQIINVEIDPTSFVIVGGGAIKDNRRVYIKDDYNNTYNLLTNVDAPTFQYIGVCESVEKSSGIYFKDKNHVFVEKEPIDSIDVSSFQYFGAYASEEGMPYAASYARDINNIYHSCGEILNDADKLTFSDLKDGYAKDKNKVWYLAGVLSDADVATFQSLGEGYAKDKSNAYFGGFIIKKVDVTTFTIVKENVAADEYGRVYAKDKNNVYFGTEIIKGVNPVNCTAESIKNCTPNP